MGESNTHSTVCPHCHRVTTTLVSVHKLHYRVCPKCAKEIKKYVAFLQPGKLEVGK